MEWFHVASIYITFDEYKLRTLLPSSYVDLVEAEAPGFVDAQIAMVSSLDIDGRLRKRYAAPFAEPVPEAVKAWTTRLVDIRVLRKRGSDPQDPDVASVIEDAVAAKAELLEAANGETGLWDLPLRDNTSATGIVSPQTRGYSENSPYVGFSKQASAGREEDSNGEGTFT